jgi:hypothetical protein
MSSNGYKAIVHYYLQKDCWSIHVKYCCYQGHYVIIDGPWGTEAKPNRKSNPRGWARRQIPRSVPILQVV